MLRICPDGFVCVINYINVSYDGHMQNVTTEMITEKAICFWITPPAIELFHPQLAYDFDAMLKNMPSQLCVVHSFC